MPRKSKSKDPLICAALEIISHRIDDEMSIDDIVARLDTSKYHFMRNFKSTLGVTVGGYIRKRKLQVAAERLCGSEMTINAIAFSVGYGSQAAFCRAFKSEFGLNPSAFRSRRDLGFGACRERPVSGAGRVPRVERDSSRRERERATRRDRPHGLSGAAARATPEGHAPDRAAEPRPKSSEATSGTADPS